MKSFKEYLTESKKTYEFKVKIAGDCPKDCAKTIKSALSQFHVESCSAGKSTPIQEHQSEFPEHKNVGMTIFDVCTTYPATTAQVRDSIAEHLGIALSKVRVRNEAEEREHALNHANDKLSGEALLTKDYEKSSGQDLVGEKHKMNFLQELGKNKHQGTEITGTNDVLLAKKAPVGKQEAQSTTSGAVSAIGSKKSKLPDLMGGK